MGGEPAWRQPHPVPMVSKNEAENQIWGRSHVVISARERSTGKSKKMNTYADSWGHCISDSMLLLWITLKLRCGLAYFTLAQNFSHREGHPRPEECLRQPRERGWNEKGGGKVGELSSPNKRTDWSGAGVVRVWHAMIEGNPTKLLLKTELINLSPNPSNMFKKKVYV